MAFQFREKLDSRRTSLDPPSAIYEYVATGETNHATVEAYAVAMTSPMIASSAGVLHRQNVELDPVGSDFYNVTVTYGPREKAVGAWKFSFDTTGGTQHIVASKETIATFPNGGPDCKQLIGVHGDNVDGTDVVIPALRFSITISHPAGVVTIAMVKQLARFTGMTNDRAWLGFAAGEVLFLGARGEDGSTSQADVTLEFLASENATGLTVGDIVNVEKKGHEVAWIAYEDDVDGGLPVKVPATVYVERVYESTNFSAAFGIG